MSERVRKTTLSPKRGVTRLHRLRVVAYPDDIERPRVRGDCLPGGCNEERPCPWISCRYHLAIDVLPNGGLTLNFPDRDLEELPDTCALDVADQGGLVLELVGERLNITRERTRQIEEHVLFGLPDDEIVRLQEVRR